MTRGEMLKKRGEIIAEIHKLTGQLIDNTDNRTEIMNRLRGLQGILKTLRLASLK
jgi:hypothetical protein